MRAASLMRLGSLGPRAMSPGLGIWDCTHHLSSASVVCSSPPTSRWTDVQGCLGCFTGCRLKGSEKGRVSSAVMLMSPPALQNPAQP